ncbi:hypothetical protein C8T65DRAFT_671458 [Cerioporus squamosus]|nr:hypothetical protein C8T65DRAFT_671458 [Cerioporus squamosus]
MVMSVYGAPVTQSLSEYSGISSEVEYLWPGLADLVRFDSPRSTGLGSAGPTLRVVKPGFAPLNSDQLAIT